MTSKNKEWLYTLSQKKSKLTLFSNGSFFLLLVVVLIGSIFTNNSQIGLNWFLGVLVVMSLIYLFGYCAYLYLFKLCNLYLSKSRDTFVAKKLFKTKKIPISELEKILVLTLTIKLVFHGGMSIVFFDLYKIVNKPLWPYNTDFLEGYIKRKERKALFLKKLASFEVFLDF
jgi:hypothetical protein